MASVSNAKHWYEQQQTKALGLIFKNTTVLVDDKGFYDKIYVKDSKYEAPEKKGREWFEDNGK